MNKMKGLMLLAGVSLLGACASSPTPIPGSDVAAATTLPAASDTTVMVGATTGPVAADSDRDGITNQNDRCVDSTPGSMVDLTGCEIVTGVIEGLSFGPNETRLSVDSRRVLSDLVDVFLRYPDVVLSVEGHTDNRGTAADNLELSKQRVLSVVRYMVSNGISPDRLKPYGYGESRPRAANATAAGREQNRRIEINVVDSLL